MKPQMPLKFATLLLMQCLTIVVLSAQVPSIAEQTDKSPTQFPDGSAYVNSNLTYKIIDASNNTFGYDVFVDGKLMIHQLSIPAMPGIEGFKTKEDAVKVAELVIHKIGRGEMPPTVSTEELKSIGVTK